MTDEEKKKVVFRRKDDKIVMKEAFKEAFSEMLDKHATKFGWFAIKTITLLAGGGLIWFILTVNGWHKT